MALWNCARGLASLRGPTLLQLIVAKDGIWSVDCQENHSNCCQQMLDFKAKMHQMRIRLGLRPRPRRGSLQRSPDLLAGFKGPTSKGREGRGGKRRGRKGGKGRGRKGREGKGKGWMRDPMPAGARGPALAKDRPGIRSLDHDCGQQQRGHPPR